MNFNFSAIKRIHPRSLAHLSTTLTSLVEGRLWLKVLIGMVLGIGLGITMGPSLGWFSPELSSTIGNWVTLPGQVFLGLVQMVVVPLVIASIIRGLVAGEDIQHLKKLGLATVLFFLLTTVIAIVLGIGLAYLIKPGAFIDPAQVKNILSVSEVAQSVSIVPDSEKVPLSNSISSLIPRNPIGAMLNLEMLQLVFFSVIVGLALLSLSPTQSKPLLELLGSVQELCMAIVKWAMHLAPFAVFGFMAKITSSVGLNALVGMSVYVGTVLLGLFILLLFYYLIIGAFTKQSVFQFMSAIKDLQLLAFSTSSSAAVMPLSMKTSEEKLGVPSSIVQFVIPMGTTINMTGTALYQGVATIFLAQVFGIELSLGALVLVVLTAVGASIGSPGTPGVGIVILSMVLASAGIPASGIALIMGMDRILDMSRTSLNVTGDVVASVVVSKLTGQEVLSKTLQRIEDRVEKKRNQTNEDVVILPDTKIERA